jgi:hypothetical protein
LIRHSAMVAGWLTRDERLHPALHSGALVIGGHPGA